MKFFLDQNLSPKTTTFLRELGYDATDARELGLCHTPDIELLKASQAAGRILVTFDLDFSDIRLLKSFEIPGVIIFRTNSFSSKTINRLFNTFLSQRSPATITGNLFIINESCIRSRPLI